MEDNIKKVKEIVKERLSCSAHSIDHVMRVYKLAQRLAKTEDNVDLEVLKYAALLHDIARVEEDTTEKNIDHAKKGAKEARKILRDFNLNKEKIDHIAECIRTHRFRDEKEPKTIEAKILFDADKLDVTGAVGIARTFIYTGQYGQKMYSDKDPEQYAKENIKGPTKWGKLIDKSKHTPNLEFEIKLKYVKERLYTKEAKKIAEERIEFMDEFYKRLRKEYKGEI